MRQSVNLSPLAWLGTLAVLCVATLAGLPPDALAANEAGEYADNDSCAACHEEIAVGLAETQHGKRALAERSPHGCQACHGPAAAHVEDPTVEANRPRVPDLGPAGVAARCQGCHAGGGHMFWKGGRHASAGVTCIDCHGVHEFASVRGQLKKATVADTCFQCHKSIRTDVMRSSHHPIREGKISCKDCHDPHGTPNDNNVPAGSVNEKCYECHAEKRGPFLWEHPPVRENCLSCHTPHGSNHQKLQRTSVPYLCQQCHSNTRHPGTLYDAEDLPGAPSQSNRVFERSCVNCHAAIHGSNHPSGPYLGR